MAERTARALASRHLPTYSGGVVRVDTTNGLVGTELAGYLIESIIGRGGMGVVYLAEHRRLKRKVALKVLAPERAANERFRRRFLEESRIAAGLNHPNVIPIHDADEADGVLFLAMRYVEGKDLRTLIDQEGPLEAARALRIVGQVGSALDAAHERSLVHRDVTAANVLLSADDHAYLCDFGLSKQSSSSVSGLSAPGEVIGTVAYMAPEQIEQGEAGPSADIYSLGCLLYQCLTGAPPYTRDSDLAVLWAHMQEEPPTISSIAPELPVGLDAVFARALAKEPTERYPTCRELVEAAFASGIGRRADLPPELDTATPLVGREAELEWLRKEWLEALAGSGRMVFVSGVRGSGKTRLAAELAQEARARGAVRYVSCLRQAGAVQGFLHDLRSADKATLAVVDDLDAADAAVIDELAAMQDGLATVPVLLFGTYRDDDTTSPGLRLAVSRAAGHRRLEGLDEEGVAAIGRLYLDSSSGVSASMILAASGGIPQRAHTMLLEWARDEASRRLAEAADYASAGRSDLRAAEAALVDHVTDIQSLAEQARLLGGADDGPAPGVCPFKGLAAFEPPDTHYFHGRERLVAELVARLVGSSLLGVVGPSGSGKSSVVRAGLLSAVAAGVLPGSQRWPRLLLRPGEHPLASLRDAVTGVLPRFDPAKPAAALDYLPEGERLFLVIDQLEEVFTLCEDEEERAGFLAALTTLARDPRCRAVIVLAIRASYYGRCAGYPELAALLGDSHVLVGPMQAEELRRAIELPAQRVGLTVEPPLVEALVDGVAGQPGGLPLLSTTLLELWQRRDGETLRLADYATMGGVHGAVARLAEDAYGRLTEAQQQAARGLLLRLAQEGEDGSMVRRRAQLAELDVETNDDVARALAVLADSRLVTVSEGTVEVAHEALLREWPRLHTWLEEDAQGHRLHQHLIQAAGEWQDAGRDPAELYRGARLASALDWSSEHGAELNELEREFVSESRDASERETKRMRRTNRRLRGLLVGIALFLAAAVAVGFVALSQRGKARDAAGVAQAAEDRAVNAAEDADAAATAADAQRLGAQALIEDRLDLSLLLARAGDKLDPSVATRGYLLADLLRSPAAIGVAYGDGGRLFTAAVSPDDRVLALGDEDGTVTLVDAETRKPVGGPINSSPSGLAVNDLAFSPDGRLTVTTVEGINFLQPGEPGISKTIELGRDRIAGDLAYSEDGKYLAVVEGVPILGPNSIETLDDAHVVIRTGDDGRPTGVSLPIGNQSGPISSEFMPDGNLVVVTRSPARTTVWDTATGQLLHSYRIGGAFALSPDGKTTALGDLRGAVTLLDVETGARRPLPAGHEAKVDGAAFSPDGETLVTTGDDAKVVVWDVPTGQVREILSGHTGRVFAPVFTSDGRTIFTPSQDGSAMVWDVAGNRRFGRPFTFAPKGGLFGAAFSPDGKTLAIGVGGSIAFWDATTREQLGDPITVGRKPIVSARFSPDGRTLAVGDQAGKASVVDVPSRSIVGTVQVGQADANVYIAFSPDGTLLAAGGSTGRVLLLNASTLKPVAPALEHDPYIYAIDFSKDGSRLAVAAASSDVTIWELPGRQKLRTIDTGDEAVYAVAFSPDGRYLVTGGPGGRLRLWETQTGALVGQPVLAHAGWMLYASFSPDGRTLATSGGDGVVRLWDVPSLRQIGKGLPATPNVDTFGEFSPDGERLVELSNSGRGLVWEMRPSAWEAHACSVAGRDLTQAEWRVFIPGRKYQAVCPQSGQASAS